MHSMQRHDDRRTLSEEIGFLRGLIPAIVKDEAPYLPQALEIIHMCEQKLEELNRA